LCNIYSDSFTNFGVKHIFGNKENDNETIALKTGLSIEEIKELRG